MKRLVGSIGKLGLCFILAGSGYSCQNPSEKSKIETAPAGAPAPARRTVAAFEITPRDAVRGTIFYAVSKNTNLVAQKVTWFVNGVPVADTSGSFFKASEVKRGDMVQAGITADGSNIFSNTVEIKNSPPEITNLKIMPEIFKPGDMLYSDATTSDADGDPVTLSYEWTKNGAAAGTGQKLDAVLKRGDRISVKVSPYDGIDYGDSIVMERELLNLPPIIEEHTIFTFDGSTYTYQVKAVDPDGDSLMYSLESAPDGMQIDPANGLVKWTVPPDFKGVRDVSVIVKDGNGGTARYNLKITVQ